MTSTATRTSKKDLVNNFARLRPKIAYFHVFSSTSTNEDEFLFHCLNLDIFLRNSTPGWFAYIYKQSKPVGIIAMKFQRTRSHF